MMPGGLRDERVRDVDTQIKRVNRRISKVFDNFLQYPPQHVRHRDALVKFQNIAPYDKSIFVMTKYPNPKNPGALDNQLSAVIEAVREAVSGCGYVARVATDCQFHPILWDNVELYLLGCRRGIAIVEDKYRPELNPNVAMEWGWMRGMGRDVLYLVEKDFANQRADWGGLVEFQFDWANPRPDIMTAVKGWLHAES